MFKQIYDKSNGNPILIESDIEGKYIYDEFLYTEIEPPSELYEPRYFNGNEWIGSTKEEWEQNNQEELPAQPNELEELKQRVNELENIVKELTQGTD